MNEVNKTLYIPLYGKSRVSGKDIILHDPKAEEIWQKEQFPLRGKARSKWLAYFMAMRARVFDDWTKGQLQDNPETLVLHIGRGMDGRILRVGGGFAHWYDVDFPDVIRERRKYYEESDRYCMLGADASEPSWLDSLPDCGRAVVVLEGLSMYLKNQEVASLLSGLGRKYKEIRVLMDVYTEFGAKASKYKNPINDVGVTRVYGIDDPGIILPAGMEFAKEHTMTPQTLVDELRGFDKWFFTLMFTGKATRKIYRLFEFRTG